MTLDRAQLVGLGFFAVLSGGLMFGLGYSAGKTRGRAVDELRPIVAQTTLQQIDKKAELHEEIKQDADLTFYKTLVEKEEKAKAAPKADAAKTEVARLEAKPDEKKSDAPTKPEKLAALDKPSAPEKTEETEEQALTSVVTVDDEPKTQAPPPSQAKLEPKDQTKEPKGTFTIQVSAFKTQIEAASYVKLLSAKGFNAHVRSATVDGKGTWYRVRVGNFPTTAQAEIYKSKLSRENLPAWIVKAD